MPEESVLKLGALELGGGGHKCFHKFYCWGLLALEADVLHYIVN